MDIKKDLTSEYARST